MRPRMSKDGQEEMISCRRQNRRERRERYQRRLQCNCRGRRHEDCRAWEGEDTKLGLGNRKDKETQSKDPEGRYREDWKGVKVGDVFCGKRKVSWTRRKSSMIYKWT